MKANNQIRLKDKLIPVIDYHNMSYEEQDDAISENMSRREKQIYMLR